MIERVEEVLKEVGVKAKIKEVKKIKASRREKESIIVMRVGIEDMKKNILTNKWRLKNREM